MLIYKLLFTHVTITTKFVTAVFLSTKKEAWENLTARIGRIPSEIGFFFKDYYIEKELSEKHL